MTAWSSLLLVGVIVTSAACGDRSTAAQSSDAGALATFAQAWCANWQTCRPLDQPYSGPCCWETDQIVSPELQAQMDLCLRDLDDLGCDIQEVVVGDAGVVEVRTNSAACLALPDVGIGYPGIPRPWGPYACSGDWFLAGTTCTCRDSTAAPVGASGWGADCAAAIAAARDFGAWACASSGGMASCGDARCARQYSAGGGLDGGH